MPILVTGASGQIGSELVPYLRKKFGAAEVIATYIPEMPLPELMGQAGPSVMVDATDRNTLKKVIVEHSISEIYHLVGILSARGERDPELAWHTNMESLRNVLALSVECRVKKVFWPSSIAAFGPSTPRFQTPQHTIMEPTTVYGVTKVAGELLAQYYNNKYHLDIRSLRLPGIISYKTPPGGGTTDYAVEVFSKAVNGERYTFFVRPDTVLPMMYMDDAIRAIDLLMSAEANSLTIHSSYNLTALDFSAADLQKEIQKFYPKFVCDYQPDFRQAIADSWPATIDDSVARQDWGWKPRYSLAEMTKKMLEGFQEFKRDTQSNRG